MSRDIIYFPISKLHPDALCPTRAHPDDAGLDLFTPREVIIGPRDSRTRDVLVGTGIAMAIPEGYAGIVMPKSGRAVNDKLIVGACVIDSGYRGEIKVHLVNLGLPVVLEANTAIAQLVIVPVSGIMPLLVENLDDYAKPRGRGGFGSTGLNHPLSEGSGL